MKHLLMIVVCVTLVGCGKMDQLEAKITGYSKVCVNGVSYVQFTSGAALQVDINNKPVSC